MKKGITLLVVFLMCGLSSSIFAAPYSITDMIGDNDGYGYGDALVPDNGTLPFTNNPSPGNGWLFDNRSAAELAAVNGAQATDVQDNFDVTFHHAFNMAQFNYLTSATFTIDISGVQQGVFGGYSHLYLDGVELMDFQALNQGAWGSNVFTYDVDLSMLADGALDVYFDNFTTTSDDHMAIDFTMLTVNGDAVPEPASMLLFGLGMAGLGVVRRFRK